MAATCRVVSAAHLLKFVQPVAAISLEMEHNSDQKQKRRCREFVEKLVSESKERHTAVQCCCDRQHSSKQKHMSA